MADTPTNGETAKPGDSQTTVTTSATPQVNAVDAAEVERLRKEAEQAKMRANQLQNELEAKARAEEEARLKALEEQNEWKAIAEQNKAKLEALEREREEARAQQELANATNQILSTFSSEVQEEAKALGITLSSVDEAAQADFKAKLDRLNEKLSAKATPQGNNPAPRVISDSDQLMRIRSGDTNARYEAIANLQAVKTMREMSGYSQNQ